MMFWGAGIFSNDSNWSDLLGLQTCVDFGDYALLGPGTPSRMLPKLLVVPPASGHASTLMADLTVGFRESADIYVLHLRDPKLMPEGSVQFGVQDQVRAISKSLAVLKNASASPLWCLAACQAAGPALMAAATSTPDAIAFVAAPLNPRAKSGGVAKLFETQSHEGLLDTLSALTRTLSNGRRVLPAPVQMAAILQGKGGAARVLAQETYASFWPASFFTGNKNRSRFRRAVLTDGQNIDARLLREALRFNFIDRPFDGPESLMQDMDIPILTVAGSADTIVPAAQCHSIEDICGNAKIESYTAPSLDHFDLFFGDTSQFELSPKILDFFVRTAT